MRQQCLRLVVDRALGAISAYACAAILISCAGAVGGVKKAGVRAGIRSAVQGENGPVPESEIATAGFNERTRSVPFSGGGP